MEEQQIRNMIIENTEQQKRMNEDFRIINNIEFMLSQFTFTITNLSRALNISIWYEEVESIEVNQKYGFILFKLMNKTKNSLCNNEIKIYLDKCR